MKIAHIVCSFPPYYSGMGNVADQMTRGLAARGHEVVVYTPIYFQKDVQKKKEKENIAEGLREVKRRLPKIKYGNAAILHNMEEELNKYDVVHLHYPFFGTANLIRKWKKKNPEKSLIVTYHMDNRGSGVKKMLFDIYKRYWMPKILGAADAITTASLDFAKHSDARQSVKKNPGQWHQIPFGVDINRFKEREIDTTLAASIGIDPDVATVLFVGGMDKAHYFKGIEVLLKAAFMIKRQMGQEIQIVLVGDGELRAEYEVLAEALNLSAVTFVGHASEEDLPKLYNIADVLVLPSIDMSEAFGMVLLEAFASSIPVVASDLPGVRKIANQAGITVEPGNEEELAEALYNMIVNDEKRLELGQRGRVFARKKYTWKRVARKLETLYKKHVPSA